MGCMYRQCMCSYFEDDCNVLYTCLFLSTAFELSKCDVLFDSMKAMKMGCYNFGIRVVVPLGFVGVSLLSFCCVFLLTYLAWL